MPLAVLGSRTPTSIPFDSKAVIDVEYVPMPYRSGAEALVGGGAYLHGESVLATKQFR